MKLVFGCLLGLTGCRLITDSFVTNDFSGDIYPISVETTSGAVVIGVREAGAPDRIAVVDTLSPVTLIDPGLDVSPTVTSRDLLLLGNSGSGTLDLPRAQLTDARVLALHPCNDASCVVGPAAGQRQFDAIIGADSLAGDALRLRLGDDRAFLLADIAGSEQDRARVCDAVYPAPYRGGGTLVVAGTELGFSGRRVTMPTCLGPVPDQGQLLPQSQRGADALMLISTSIGPSLLGESAYLRYQQIHAAALPLDQLPTSVIFMPSGAVTGRAAVIDSLALVARSSSTPRAACRHVYAHHLLLERNCVTGDDCPCENGNKFCPLPALVEVAPTAGIDVLVIPDDNPTLQALRTELRPDQAEVDGILGTSALKSLELDVDYPHDRVLARCTTGECTMRTALNTERERDEVFSCLDFKQ